MLSKTTVESILDCALTHGGDFAEVFCEDSSNTTLLVTGDRVGESSLGHEYGVGIRIFRGLNSIYAYTNKPSEETLLNLTKKAAQALKGNPEKPLPLEPLRQVQLNPFQILPRDVAYSRKLDLTRRAIQAGMAFDPCVTQMTSKYLDIHQQVQIANTEGCFVEDTRVKTRLYINAYADKGNGIQTGYIGPGAMKGFEFYDNLDVEAYAQEAARIAVVLAGAENCPSGQMPVIIDNGFGGLMFHEACGHSLEASSVAKGTSEFSGRVGEKVASDLLTLIDDGSMPGEWGSLGVDDEGTPTQKNVLIENGILKGYLVDKLNARRMGVQPTGSGRRQNYRFAPTSRMTNTYIANGTSSRDEMIANTERGLFVKYINAGSVNPATGEFNFSASEAYLIENGKLTTPVKGATLIGTGSEILREVDMVGSNLDIRQGYCFAASGALFINAGQPTVRVSRMTVGGVNG